MFVHALQVQNIVRRHPEIIKARQVVSGQMANDLRTLHCEVAATLPADGKAIEDARDYS